ncbi:MAG: hypothetical protein OEZ59_00010 [Deltaproteobacteria bacterium]|nr:hypothetical protein [Deltaproteobacteria bacterium]
MTTQIDLIIRALDNFSPVFEKLDKSFLKWGSNGAGAVDALEDINGSMEDLVRQTGMAEGALAGFSASTTRLMTEAAEEQRARNEEFLAARETAALDHHDRMLALEQDVMARKTAQREIFRAQEEQAQGAHYAGLLAAQQAAGDQAVMVDAATLMSRYRLYEDYRNAILNLARDKGGQLARAAKALAVAEATVMAYLAANNALASAPYPFNIPLAALVLAQGLANVERIRQVGIAHSGLENVPEDGTYVLRQGERVLSPAQNRDLSRFLDGGPGGSSHGVRIDSIVIHILENATSAEALLNMNPADLKRIVAEKIFPAMDELADQGIRPAFTE